MSDVTYTPRRRRPGCLFLILLMLAVGAVIVWVMPPSALETGIPRWRWASGEALGTDEFPPLREIWSEGGGSNKVVRIPVTGMILLGESPTFISPGGSADLALRAIRRATRDREVKAIILDIDSGGGGITASDILYDSLLAFKQADPDRRIVALCGDLTASGAYYIALAADRIIAHPTTVTGSIGVIIQSINIRELATRHGIVDVTFKSGDNKDLLNPLGAVSEEQRAIVQEVVDTMHRRFITLVAARRPIAPDTLEPLTDGRIFTADQALTLGLIDEIGYSRQAVERTRELLDLPDIIVYRYEDTFSFRQWIRMARTLHPRAWFRHDSTPRLQYRWAP